MDSYILDQCLKSSDLRGIVALSLGVDTFNEDMVTEAIRTIIESNDTLFASCDSYFSAKIAFESFMLSAPICGGTLGIELILRNEALCTVLREAFCISSKDIDTLRVHCGAIFSILKEPISRCKSPNELFNLFEGVVASYRYITKVKGE